MTAVAMNNLWTYIQGLNLSARNQKWLGERLITESKQPRTRGKEDLTPYTMEEIETMLREAKEDYQAGRYRTNDEVFGHKRAIAV